MEKELSDLLLFQLHRISGLTHRSQKEARGNMELLRGQGRILRFLDEKDGLPQQKLAEKNNIQAGSLSELLKKMEQKNHVSREQNLEDKRKFNIFITPEGREIAQRMKNARKEISEKMVSGLSEEEQQELSRLLGKIIDSLDD